MVVTAGAGYAKAQRTLQLGTCPRFTERQLLESPRSTRVRYLSQRDEFTKPRQLDHWTSDSVEPVLDMSTIEALRTQLDTVNSQLLSPGSRKQKAAGGTTRTSQDYRCGRTEVDAGRKCTTLSANKRDRTQELDGGDEASGTPRPEAEVGQLQEKLASLEEEAATLKSRCIAQTEELEEEKRLNVMQREELEGEREA